MRKKALILIVLFILFSVTPLAVADNQEYVVKKGDTVFSIAEKMQIAPDSIIIMNNLGPAPLVKGQVLTVPESDDVVVKPSGDGIVSASGQMKINGKTYSIGKSITTDSFANPCGEITINGNVVFRLRGSSGSYDMQERVDIVYERMMELAQSGFNPDDILPMRDNDSWAVVVGDKHIVNIDTASMQANNLGEGELAFAWANLLRESMDVAPLELEELDLNAMATYYDDGSHTASGEAFLPDAISAAHRTLPFGTKVLVSDLKTKKSVVVRVNDRGPYVDRYEIDLSRGAASALGSISRGIFNVRMYVLRFDRENYDQ